MNRVFVTRNSDGMTVREMKEFLFDKENDSVLLIYGADKNGYNPLETAEILNEKLEDSNNNVLNTGVILLS